MTKLESLFCLNKCQITHRKLKVKGLDDDTPEETRDIQMCRDAMSKIVCLVSGFVKTSIFKALPNPNRMKCLLMCSQ